MSLSLQEVKNFLVAKGGYSITPAANQLQDLRVLVNNMLQFRSGTNPGDGEASQAGTTCLTHTVPSSYNLSLQDIKDINILSCSCNFLEDKTAYCESRVARDLCECNVDAYCDCYTREGPFIPPTCDCQSRTGTYDNTCPSRGSCSCLSRTAESTCSCNSRTGSCDCVSRTVTACECNSRTTSCTCNTDTIAACTCNTRTLTCNCVSRTGARACECNIYILCNCQARTACTCNSRVPCSANCGNVTID